MALPTSGISLGEYTAGLSDVAIAQWNSAGSYGTLVDIPSVKSFNIELQTVNNILEGDNAVTSTFATLRSVQVTFQFGFYRLDVLEVLTGKAITSGTTPTNYENLALSALNFPYFTIVGKTEWTEGQGEIHFHIRKVKVLEGFTLNMEYGQYVTPEITALAVPESSGGVIVDIRQYDSAQSLVVPLP